MRNVKLINALRNIKAINPIPMKDFRECMVIVKDFTYLDTPHEFIQETLKDRLNVRQIERLIDFYNKYHKTNYLKSVNRITSDLFPRDIVDKANAISHNEKQKEVYKNSPERRREVKKNVKKGREKKEFDKWMEQHRPTVKTRKPKPKKTFWHVPVKEAKYRSNLKK